MKKKIIFTIFLFLPFLLLGESETYNQQIVINLWNKNLKEITEIKKVIENAVEKFNLEVKLQDIPEIEIEWEKRKN